MEFPLKITAPLSENVLLFFVSYLFSFDITQKMDVKFQPVEPVRVFGTGGKSLIFVFCFFFKYMFLCFITHLSRGQHGTAGTHTSPSRRSDAAVCVGAAHEQQRLLLNVWHVVFLLLWRHQVVTAMNCEQQRGICSCCFVLFTVSFLMQKLFDAPGKNHFLEQVIRVSLYMP